MPRICGFVTRSRTLTSNVLTCLVSSLTAIIIIVTLHISRRVHYKLKKKKKTLRKKKKVNGKSHAGLTGADRPCANLFCRHSGSFGVDQQPNRSPRSRLLYRGISAECDCIPRYICSITPYPWTCSAFHMPKEQVPTVQQGPRYLLVERSFYVLDPCPLSVRFLFFRTPNSVNGSEL